MRTIPYISHEVKENILVDSTGQARLSDIGFTKLVRTGESEFDWAQVGADGCRWAAPEIFQSGEFTKESDIFSYGFIAVEVRLPNCYLVLLQPRLPRYSRGKSCGRGLMQWE